VKPNPWRRWIIAHPLLSVFLTAVYCVTVAIMATCNEALFWIGLGLLGGIVVTVSLSAWKLIPLVLLVALTAHAQEPEPPKDEAVAWGVGVVVLVGGGVVVYKMVRFCQRHFPRSDTNQPPETNLWAQGGYSDQYGGAWSWTSSGSCYSPAAVADPANVRLALFRMDCSLENGVLRVRPSMASTNQIEDASEWFADLAAWGLSMNPHGYGQSFSRNGVPCDPSAVPIRFVPDADHSIVIAGATGRILIERSPDLATWEVLNVVSVPAGMRVRMEDVGQAEQTFYRVSVR